MVITPVLTIAQIDHLCVVGVPTIPDSRIAATTADPNDPPDMARRLKNSSKGN